MNSDLKKALTAHIQEQAKLAKVKIDSDRINPLVARLEDSLVRDINLGLIKGGGDVAANSCGSFGCPQSFSCDWF